MTRDETVQSTNTNVKAIGGVKMLQNSYTHNIQIVI